MEQRNDNFQNEIIQFNFENYRSYVLTHDRSFFNARAGYSETKRTVNG